jgi:hypothetical protein
MTILAICYQCVNGELYCTDSVTVVTRSLCQGTRPNFDLFRFVPKLGFKVIPAGIKGIT